MSEGLFSPTALAVPGIAEDLLCTALVRVLPRTILVLDLVETVAQADSLARNESQPDGSERWYRYFPRDDLARVAEPAFAMGMVRHEFARAVLDGASFPVVVPLDGGGTGFAIDGDGHVLTNYHLVTSEVGNHGREAGAWSQEAQCRTLRVQIASRGASGEWLWTDAQEVYLVSNPPADRAIVLNTEGRAELREDTALLRVVPSPADHLELAATKLLPGAPVWMAGFPLRTARSPASLASIGYSDADGTLRISAGHITTTDLPDSFTTDLDGSMGNSGSPVFDAKGRVIGLFSRTTGDGPRNAFEYGFVQRVHVTADLAIRGLRLQRRSL